MTVQLQITSDDMDAGELDQFTRELNEALADVPGVSSDLRHRPLQDGERGGAVVIGGILLDLLKSSAAAKLIEVLGAHFTRERSAKAKITGPDGKVVEVDFTNFDADEVHKMLGALSPGSAGA